MSHGGLVERFYFSGLKKAPIDRERVGEKREILFYFFIFFILRNEKEEEERKKEKKRRRRKKEKRKEESREGKKKIKREYLEKWCVVRW